MRHSRNGRGAKRTKIGVNPWHCSKYLLDLFLARSGLGATDDQDGSRVWLYPELLSHVCPDLMQGDSRHQLALRKLSGCGFGQSRRLVRWIHEHTFRNVRDRICGGKFGRCDLRNRDEVSLPSFQLLRNWPVIMLSDNKTCP